MGKLQEAEQYSSKLLSDAPDSAPVHAFAYEVALAQDQLEEALSHIIRATEIDGDYPEYQLKKAHVELVSRQGLKAQETVTALAARYPDDQELQLEVARIFGQCGNHKGAEPFLLKAGAKQTKNPEILFEYSNNQFFLGNTDEAEQAISTYLDLQLPPNGRKLLLRSQLRRQTPENNHVEMLQNYLARPLARKEAVNCLFALAKELEDLGEYEQSFDALKSGAELQRQLLQFDLPGELNNLQHIITTFQPEKFASIPDGASREAPVFIVGMPRTGTTLVERIISQQEGVKSGEETYDFTLAFSSVINGYMAANPGRNLTPLSAALEVDYNEIARIYLDNMRGMLGEADRYLDKTPFNFLYCGLIKKAFPNARIVHLVRDPMDTCYAVFKILFARAYFFSYDLEELADYYITYRQLMDHWHRLMPGAILDVHYEELVSNPLDVSRQIADFVGLDWSSELIEVQNFSRHSSTASAAQVREPIHTGSISRWRSYETELEPLRRKLLAANLVEESGE